MGVEVVQYVWLVGFLCFCLEILCGVVDRWWYYVIVYYFYNLIKCFVEVCYGILQCVDVLEFFVCKIGDKFQNCGQECYCFVFKKLLFVVVGLWVENFGKLECVLVICDVIKGIECVGVRNIRYVEWIDDVNWFDVFVLLFGCVQIKFVFWVENNC